LVREGRPVITVAGLERGLRKGPEGYVILNPTKRVTGIVVKGNAEASGVGIGDGRSDLRRAFPHADHSPSVVRVWGEQRPLLTFFLTGKPKRVEAMGAPDVAYCE
jgi:hypothetical protein